MDKSLKPYQLYEVNPDNYEKIDDEEFEGGNEVISIYPVINKITHKIYIKKDFYLYDENENRNESENTDSDDCNPKDDSDDCNPKDDSDDCNPKDYSDDYSQEDACCNHTNTKKYFMREVKHLIEVQIKGYPFLRFKGFNYRIAPIPFIITKKLKGKTLGHLIKDNFSKCENPSTTKMIIFYGVAFALKILHSKKIIHRDIKPDNIFLNKKYEPYLGDFGFARLIQESPKLTENVGTTFYMAPELFEDNNTVPSDKVDSYSFAVTILEALTLNLTIKLKSKILMKNNPDDSDDLFVSVVREHIKKGKRYILPDDLPEEYKNLIKACWSANQNERLPMSKIVTMMEDGKLNLPGFDRDKFTQYVNKLKKAEKEQKRINFGSDSDDDSDEYDDSPKKESKKTQESDSDDDDDSPKKESKKTQKSDSDDDDDSPKKESKKTQKSDSDDDDSPKKESKKTQKSDSNNDDDSQKNIKTDKQKTGDKKKPKKVNIKHFKPKTKPMNSK